MSKKNNNRNYRATFLLDTRNYQQPVETLVEKVTGTIESVKGSIKKVNNLGQKEFARVTKRKFPSGIYLELLFEGPSDAPAAIKEKLRLDRNVNRILVESI